MKRMMMLIAVMALAGSAMATSVKWGIGTGALATGAFADGSTLYLVWDNNAGGFSYNGVLSEQSSFTIGNVLDSQQGSGSLASGAYFNATGTTITPATLGVAAGLQPFYLVAISADGLSIGYTATKTANIQSSALSATISWAGTDFTVTTVPEPTSMALLALGAAALGLRRKFRK